LFVPAAESGLPTPFFPVPLVPGYGGSQEHLFCSADVCGCTGFSPPNFTCGLPPLFKGFRGVLGPPPGLKRSVLPSSPFPPDVLYFLTLFRMNTRDCLYTLQSSPQSFSPERDPPHPVPRFTMWGPPAPSFFAFSPFRPFKRPTTFCPGIF